MLPMVTGARGQTTSSEASSPARLANRAERAHICTMTNVKVTCNCGAIYEVIETKGPSRDPHPFKCVLCEKELFAWEGTNVG